MPFVDSEALLVGFAEARLWSLAQVKIQFIPNPTCLKTFNNIVNFKRVTR